MKKYWRSLLAVCSIATLSASTAFGQFGYNGYNGYNGACAPNCELPPVCEPVAPACEPVCDVPPTACEPTCDVPPTCGPALGCAPYCDSGYGYGCGYGGFCNPCYDVAAIVGGALDVATAPFHWAAAMLTEGIYPDCGCAPRPPKTNCDPCDMCGNFVGGCGEECETPVCANNYGYNNYGAGSYPVGAYDAETYDASPTRQKSAPGPVPTTNAAPETLPQEAVRRGDLSFAPRPQAPRYGRPSFAFGGFDVQALVNNKRQAPSRVAPRPVRYEEEYVVQAPAPNASPIRQVSGLTRSTQNAPISQAAVVPHSTEIRRSARCPQTTRTVVPNVRSTQPASARPLADATPVVEERAAGRPRTFGQVRPNSANAR
ncbi:MAG: hypothetical protein IKU86_00970 [Thermoguttaceae bacterium]|nr:hypothetical protein [Thermoguttaceae bacterium]